MDKVIAARRTGTENRMGADWAIETQIQRVERFGRVTWLVRWGVVQGIAFTEREYKTRQSALLAFNS